MRIKPNGANQTVLETGKADVLFSYQTPVACEYNGQYYRTATKYSNTTTRHINTWLCGINAEEKPQEFFDNLVA